MRAPIGLMGATLVLWGFAIGFPVAGAILGMALEALRLVPAAPSLANTARLALVVRACIFLAVGSLVLAIATGRFPHALYSWLRWLPLCFLPLAAASLLAGGTVPLAAFVAALRPAQAGAAAERRVDATFAFAAVTLVAAGAGGRIEQWFYFAAAAIVSWALVAGMPRRRLAAGVGLLVLGAAIGYGVHRGLWILQGEIEDLDPELLQGFFKADPDPFRERTRIGDLGRIKLNDRIVMRVFIEGPRPASVLLRENAFDRYQGGEWQASKRAFHAVKGEGERWVLREGDASARLAVRRTLPGGQGMLALPAGAHVVSSLPAQSVEALPTGAVRVKGTPRYVTMQVTFDEHAEGGSDAADLALPQALLAALDRVIAEEGLRKDSAGATVAAVERFFADKFSYSLNLSGADGGGSRTIADFLLRDHKGHCEYFATATVLLLRRAGVPARYAVGFSAQEYSPLEKAFLVRNRHAHAWSSALVDGRWTAIDTTPSRWALEEEEAARGLFGPFLDRFSFEFDRLLQWWLGSTPGEVARAITFAIGLVLIPLALMLLRRKWHRRAAARPKAALGRTARAWQAIEAQAARRGHGRARDETALSWARRIAAGNPGESWRAELLDLARRYYSARFDPAAADPEIDAFVRAAARWKMAP